MLKFKNTITGRVVEMEGHMKDRPQDYADKEGQVDTKAWREAVHHNSTLARMEESSKWESVPANTKTKPAEER